MTKLISINIEDHLRLKSDSSFICVEYGFILDRPYICNYRIRPTLAAMVKDWIELFLFIDQYILNLEKYKNQTS